MTILWCGGEDIDFPNGAMPIPYISSYHRADYARCALYGRGSYGWSNDFTICTDMWVSFYLKSFGGISAYDSVILGIVTNNQTNTGFWLRKLSGKTYLAKCVSGTFTNLAYESGTTCILVLGKIDVHIVWGSSGSITVYCDGKTIIEYSGDTTISGSDGYNRIGVLGTNVFYNSFSEVIVSDEDTRLLSLKSIYPNAAGDTSDNWTGAYTDIDETTLSDSDKIYSATDNADIQCNLTGMPTGTWSVKAVKVAARCVDGSGSNGIQLGVKSGGTVNVGDTQTASGYWQTKERLMNVNPVTGVAWTPAEIDALQINLRAKAL